MELPQKWYFFNKNVVAMVPSVGTDISFCMLRIARIANATAVVKN
jgi:hypothetical protein